MKLKIILASVILLSLASLATTWGAWNGITVGHTTGNIGKWNDTTIGSASGNIGGWNGMTSPSSGAAPAFVQASPVRADVGTTGAAILSSPATIGNAVAVLINFSDAVSVTSIDNGVGDSATVCGVVTDNVGAGTKSAIYLAKNIAHTNQTYTVHFSGSSIFNNTQAIEYSGGSTTAPCDTTGSSANQGSTGTSLTPGAATPTNNFTMRLDFCSTSSAGGPWTLTSGWSSRNNASGFLAEDKTFTSASSQNPAITATNTGHAWICQQVAIVGALQ